ncbi:MAG: hypothetical protein M5U01_22190 [Ardenticatenaceae bacterium]|nr:hypothetical protein [Ardenticatenaceae bacterium]HBY98753.1 hypothetical protein [Chloroflexota bacterium]
MKKQNRPTWWVLDLIVVAGIGLLFWQHRWPLSPGLRQVVQVLLVLAIYGLMGLWVFANSEALEQQEQPTRGDEQSLSPLAPPQTATQAHYRATVLTGDEREEVE